MIRPFTLITAMLFVLSGAYLFAVKHRSQMLDGQIAQTTQATRLDEQRIMVLQAQWALEVDPSRLAQLSIEFTNLQPMKPSQLVTLAALDAVLPPPGSAPPVANAPAAVPALSSTAPPPPPAPPVKLASVAPPPQGLGGVEALLRTLPAPHHAAHAHHAAPHEFAQDRPMFTPGAQVVAVRDITPPAPNPAPNPALMDGGSMLGMAQDSGSNN